METIDIMSFQVYAIGVFLGFMISCAFYYFLFNSKEF